MTTALAKSDPQLGFPAKGSLKRVPFPRLVREIARARLTGSLYLLSGETKKVVFFESGQPVFVRSNVLSECLGQILSHEGLITQEQCEQTLEAIRRTGKKQGELLVEMGILSEGNLRYGLEAQLRAKLFDIFAWEDGRYQFKTDRPATSFGVRLALSAEGVIVGAIQDQYGEERALAALAALGSHYVLMRNADAHAEDLDLLPEELYFARCLDGSRTLESVLAEDHEPHVPTPGALLHGLIQAGVVELLDAPLPARPRPTPPPESRAETVPDEALLPGFTAQDAVTEYEDTPLPGELPKARALLGDHEVDFDDVDADLEPSQSISRVDIGISDDLVAAEPASVEETFDDDQIELSPEDEAIELVEAPGDAVAPEPVQGVSTRGDTGPAPAAPAPIAPAPAPIALVPEPEVRAPEPAEAPEPPPLLSPMIEPAANVVAVEPPYVDSLEAARGQTSPNIEAPTIAIDLEAGPVPLAGRAEPALAQDIEELDPELLDPGSLEADADLYLPDDLGDIDSTLHALDDELDDLDDGPIEELDDVEELEAVDALVGFDELDDIELDGVSPAVPRPPGPTLAEESAPELRGAIRFNEAETAMGNGDFPRVVSLLESAYENGFDVAELHAMLAYARFMAAGQDVPTAQHAFELLDYAQTMDPSLDLVHAYRGAIFQAMQQPQQAREALGRALELNPYCELAIELMDRL